jgi:hypothetical protein
MYYIKDGVPTKLGMTAVTVCLVEGLGAHIHHAHQSGVRDSAEHLQSAIAQLLERSFARAVEVSLGEFEI